MTISSFQLIFLALLFVLTPLAAQKPFDCTSQFFIGQTHPGNHLQEIFYSPATHSVDFQNIPLQLNGKELSNGVFVWIADVEMQNGNLVRRYGNIAVAK